MSDSSSQRLSLADLLERLAEEVPAVGAGLADTVERAEAVASSDGEPWYLRVLSLAGAVLSVAFLALALTGLGTLLDVPDALLEHWAAWLAVGFVLIAAGVNADKSSGDTLFVSHLASVSGITGLGITLGGTVLLGHFLLVELYGLSPTDQLGALWLGGMAVPCLFSAVSLHTQGGDRRFYSHLAFAASVAGQGLALFAGYLLWDAYLPGGDDHPMKVALVIEGLIAALLYRNYDAGFHRFATTLVVSGLAVATIFEFGPGSINPYTTGLTLGTTGQMLLLGLFALETAAVAVVFSPSRWLSLSTRLSLQPLGYACALTIAGLSSELFLLEVAEVGALWPYRGTVAAALIYLIYGAVDAAESPDLEPAFWGAAATVALAVVSTPGVLVGLLLLFIGIWRQQGWSLALAIVALGFHLVVFYYLMEITLFDKSLMLMASGAILLAAREWFRRRPWFGSDSPS